MSSFTRRIGRNIALKSLTKQERKERKNQPQTMRFNADGGYSVYHPTRGWKTVSARRMAAQLQMQQMMGGV